MRPYPPIIQAPVLLLLLFLVPLITAWRPTDRTCGGTIICLTSFKWCNEAGECYYPPNVYAQDESAGSSPALVWEEEYELSFKGVKQDSGPVRVQWVFLGDDESGQMVVWETELSALNNAIRFKPSSSMFLPTTSPAPHSNITFDAAQGLVAHRSMIRIQQGDAALDVKDTSDSFVVLPIAMRGIIDTALAAERRAWKRKMTMVVTVCVLETAGIAVVVARMWTRRWLLRMKNVGVPMSMMADWEP
ncbi:hypothetical protein K504DRAFT_463776 [Pleomassaria siparia CBS 279.74]|uniref:Uncharacterized protein n=1 Tax=Pleomassaria siparia CBS 279.74 TaxID=1314801 RepID=A0A6G1JSC1_9PLEO|nr:hypothetical protein K504DRAFT_463776 [Pleomassaria siparia CBS 279.74]